MIQPKRFLGGVTVKVVDDCKLIDHVSDLGW